MFTYDPTLADSLSQVRFYVGDTVLNFGPRPTTPAAPENSNFQDEELSANLTRVGDSVDVCVADLLGVLANEWTKMAITTVVGPYKEDLYRIAEGYRARVKEWKDQTGLSGYAFSSGVVRVSHDNSSEHTA